MKQKKQKIRLLLTVLAGLCITACGKPADKDCETEQEYGQEYEIEDMTETENEIKEDETVNETAYETANDNTDDEDLVITAYLTEKIEYSDEVIPVQYVDDLSLLEDLKYTDSTYVYQDGKVYYRRYHEDSYEEAALWGMYEPIAETGKEIVCIDSDGIETELFADEGYGDIYLINNRFYMTDGRLREENGMVYVETQLYSVDMQGRDRIDYGNGEILAIDQERKRIILQIREQDDTCYYAMNYETGEKKRVLTESDDAYIHIRAYRDGWIYYETYPVGDAAVSRLCAVSLEGECREILALTSSNYVEYRYCETIGRVEVDENRIYFIYGGYGGSAVVFQGGKLISVKHDGTDYKAVETSEDFFYLCHENGKTLVYFINDRLSVEDPRKNYNALVWDVDADLCYVSEFPQNILYEYDSQMPLLWRSYPADIGALCELTRYEPEKEGNRTNVYAIPDDSGKIVKVAMDLGNYIPQGETEEPGEIRELYYADGFLYFTVEYRVYDKETSIGWRDGYRRLHSDVYRLKMGESVAQMLYSY